jgi:hypothetical protein
VPTSVLSVFSHLAGCVQHCRAGTLAGQAAARSDQTHMYESYFQRVPWLRSARNASKIAGLNRQAQPNLPVVYGGCHAL